jgi:hypothetical protein
MGSAACGSDGGPPDVAAVVEGTEIPAPRVERLLSQYRQGAGAAKDQALAAEAPAAPLPDKEGRRFVLEFLIRLTLLEKLAGEHGVSGEAGKVVDLALDSTSPSDFAGTAWTPGDLKEGLQAGVLSKQLAEKLFPQVAVSPTEVERHWEAVKENFGAGWSASARAAFLPSVDAGNRLRDAVAQGAPFDDTARDLAALQVGSMGTISSATPQLSPQLRELIGGLQAGQLSVPVPAAGGFVVVLMESRQDVAARTLDDVRDEVAAAVADQKRQRLFQDWLDERSKKAEITVDSYYGRWNRERGTVSDG